MIHLNSEASLKRTPFKRQEDPLGSLQCLPFKVLEGESSNPFEPKCPLTEGLRGKEFYVVLSEEDQIGFMEFIEIKGKSVSLPLFKSLKIPFFLIRRFDLSQRREGGKELIYHQEEKAMKCPGQDMRFWKPEDIFEVQCLKCGRAIEFFKDDVKRRCRCGEEIVNPRLDFGCAQWCEYGEQCLGVMPKELEALKKELEKGRFKEKFSQAMKRYFGRDGERISHAQKVARFAEEMARKEGGNPIVVLGSAYLHEIGVYEAEKKYGNASLEYQELEGPPIVRDLLIRMNLKEEVIDEICDIIGHHRHPRPVETLNFQIFYEADWLVHLEEEGISKERGQLEDFILRIFQTTSGRRFAQDLYLKKVYENTP